MTSPTIDREPVFAASSSDLAVVRRRAAQRRLARRARGGAVVVAPLVAALAVTLHLAYPSSTHGLDVANGVREQAPRQLTGGPHHQALDTVDVAPADDDPVVGRPATGPVAGAPAARPDGTVDDPADVPADVPPILPSYSPPPSPTPTPPSSINTEPGSYEYVVGAAPSDCNNGPATNSANLLNPGHVHWCTRYLGPAELTAGRRYELPFQVCREPGAEAGTLVRHESRPDKWLSLELWSENSGKKSQWTGTSPPDDSSIRVAGGDCARWTIPWRAVDLHGHPLPSGNYYWNVQDCGYLPKSYDMVRFSVSVR